MSESASWHTGEASHRVAQSMGMPLNQVAIELGLSPAGMANLWQRRSWEPKYLYRYATIFGVRAIWLQTGEGDQQDTDARNARLERVTTLFVEDFRRRLMDYAEAVLRVVGDVPLGEEPAPAPVKKAAAKKARKKR